MSNVTVVIVQTHTEMHNMIQIPEASHRVEKLGMLNAIKHFIPRASKVKGGWLACVEYSKNIKVFFVCMSSFCRGSIKLNKLEKREVFCMFVVA